jgi:hypothetical protein
MHAELNAASDHRGGGGVSSTHPGGFPHSPVKAPRGVSVGVGVGGERNPLDTTIEEELSDPALPTTVGNVIVNRL